MKLTWYSLELNKHCPLFYCKYMVNYWSYNLWLHGYKSQNTQSQKYTWLHGGKHGYKSSQKIFFILSETFQTILWYLHSKAFLLNSKQMWHLSSTENFRCHIFHWNVINVFGWKLATLAFTRQSSIACLQGTFS